MSEYISELQVEIEKMLPEVKVVKQEKHLELLDFGLEGLKVILDNRLVFRLFKVEDLRSEDLSLYLQTKLNFSRFSHKFLNKESLYFYPNESFGSNPFGTFEKRMSVLALLIDAHKVLTQLKQDLEK